jgi:hypothetical protein
LDNVGCAADKANTGDAYPVGAIVRAEPTYTDPVSGIPIKQQDPDGVIIGNYYYAYHSGIKGKTCASQSKLESIDTAFKAAGKGIVSN